MFTNFKYFNRFMIAYSIIWVLYAIISLVINFYLLIDQWDKLVSFELVYLELRNYMFLVSMIHLAYTFGSMFRVCVLMKI